MRRETKLLLAGLALFAVVFAVACGRGGDDDAGGFGTRGESAPTHAVEAGNAGDGAAAPAEDDAASRAQAGGVDRKVVFRSAMELGVPDVAAGFDRVSAVARDAGGFVETSSFMNSEDPERQRARLTLRVPAVQYDGVLAALRALEGGRLVSESSKATEVTEQYTDLQSRLRNLQRVESQYLGLLERATTIADILTVTERLDTVRLEIEQVQGRLQLLDDLVEMATVEVTLSPISVLGERPGGGPKSFTEAFADAWEASLEAVRYVVSGAAVVTVAAIWLAVPAVALVVGVRWLGRRGRVEAS